jgi:hypothetical protein
MRDDPKETPMPKLHIKTYRGGMNRTYIRFLPREPTSYRDRRLIAGIKIRWHHRQLDVYLLGRRRALAAG